MNHSRIKQENIIEHAVLKQLSHADKEDFRIHLMECEECRMELFRMKLLLSAADVCGKDAKNKKLAITFLMVLITAMLNFTRKHAITITVVSVVIVSAVVLELQNNFLSTSDAEKTHPGSAEVFNPNNHFESIITDNLRSANQLNITSPKPDSQFHFDEKNSILFSLQATIEGAKDKEIVLKVFSNNEDDYLNDSPLYNQKVTLERESEITILSSHGQYDLKQGLYYFVLQYSNEIDYIYVGRFYVK